jgi:hypothetical protein
MCRIGDDYDETDVNRTERRQARKAHRCGDCTRTIEPGETYDHTVMLYDGYWSTYKTCAHCRAAARWLATECGGWVADEVGDELFEHWDEDPRYCTLGLGRLIVLHRAKWLRRGALVPVEDVQRWTDEALAESDRRLTELMAA